jgi:hypothetical protein
MGYESTWGWLSPDLDITNCEDPQSVRGLRCWTSCSMCHGSNRMFNSLDPKSWSFRVLTCHPPFLTERPRCWGSDFCSKNGQNYWYLTHFWYFLVSLLEAICLFSIAHIESQFVTVHRVVGLVSHVFPATIWCRRVRRVKTCFFLLLRYATSMN